MTDAITRRRFEVKIDSFDLSLAATDAHDPQSFIDGAKYWAEKNQQDALDAARYRWLRDRHDAGNEQWFVYGAHGELDDSIDAAISAEKQDAAPPFQK